MVQLAKGGLELGEGRYLHSVEKDEVELERLTIQASILDPITIRHLETIGVAERWKCLEVGAGAGSIAQWLSRRVGPTGRTVATDIDLKFLNRLSAPSLEIRRHDILKDDLEAGHYDLAHCRLLLQHLPQPEKALKRMVDAVRPGGWVLVEEQDFGSTLSLDVTDPSAKASLWVKAVRPQFDFLKKRGFAGSAYFGRRVRGLMEGLGLMEVGNEGWTRMTRGGEPMALERATAWRAVARYSVGAISQEEVESFIRLFSDPTFYYPEYTLFSAWGRKPEG